MPLSDTHTTISVQVPGHRIDMNLARDMPVSELTRSIVVFLQDVLKGDERYEEVLTWLRDAYAVWQLTTPLGVIYPGNQTVTETGIVDGHTVVLAKSKQRENYAPLMDDTAEAIAHYERLHFGQWVSSHARTLAGTLVPLSALFVSAVLVYGVARGAIGTIGQYIGAGTLGFAAAVAIVGAVNSSDTFTSHRISSEDIDKIAAGVITAGYIMASAAGMLLVLGGFGALSLLLGGGILAGTALVVTTSIRFPENINFAALALGVLVALGTGIGSAVDATSFQIAVSLAAGSTLFFLMAPRLSLILARVPMPYVPAQGESFVRDDDEDLTRIDPDRRNSVIAAIVNQERQVITARQSLVGLVWGALITIVGTAVVAGSIIETRPAMTFAFYGSIVLAMVYRGISFDDARIHRSWLIAAFVTPIALAGAAAATGKSYDLVVGTAVVVAVAVLIGCYASIKVKVVNSPVVQKMLEILETICYATPIVLLVFILDLYAQVRGR
nr:type VII secretion integral membrane protein EccD [Rhodococcus sp. (in: high G+C Gram-positive bacteria)]